MKIEYRIAGSAGGYTTLLNTDVGDTIEPWEPQYSAKAQVDALAGNTGTGGSAKIKAQGNITCALPIHAANVVYATPAAAMAASRTIPTAMLNNLVNLKVTQGTEVQYFPSACCHACRPNVQGSSVTYNMDFVTQMVTDTEPA